MSRPKQSGDYIDELDWLFNEAPGHLGLSAISYADMVRSGDVVIVDNWDHITRVHNCGWAVRKARRIEAYLKRVSEEDCFVLYKRHKKDPLPPHVDAFFGEYSGLALAIASEVEDVRDMVSNAVKNKVAITSLVAKAKARSAVAHRAYLKAKVGRAVEWAEGYP